MAVATALPNIKVELYHSRDGINKKFRIRDVSLSVMDIVARAREKFFRAPRPRRTGSIVELCQGKENSVDFFAGEIMGNLIPIISFLASEFCLSNLQNSAKLCRASEPPSEWPHHPALRRKSHPHRESPDRHDQKMGSGQP